MSLQTRLAALIAAIGADIKSLAAGKADASKGVTNGDAHDHSGGDGAQISYSSLSGLPTLGTAAPLNVAASGNAAAGEVVKGNDTRLSDSREWTAATVSQAEAEAGTATTRRAWTAERVRQAIAAWWNSVKGALVGPIGINGDLEFTGTASRIRGDFSNATLADRVLFQSSKANGATSLGAAPNGTGSTSGYNAFNAADPTNAGQLSAFINGSEVSFRSAIQGTGTYLPMTFFTGGSERVRIGASGNVGIGGTPYDKLDVYGSTTIRGVIVATKAANASITAHSTDASYTVLGASNSQTNVALAANGPQAELRTNTNVPIAVLVNSTEALRVDTSRNVLLTGSGVLGYGTGSGGTVVQSTSKSTAVTLNKPTGFVITHNETLAGGTSVNFIIFNSLCSSLDTPVVTVRDNANYIVSCVNVAGGAFRLRITNITSSALSEVISINFSIIRGASS